VCEVVVETPNLLTYGTDITVERPHLTTDQQI